MWRTWCVRPDLGIAGVRGDGSDGRDSGIRDSTASPGNLQAAEEALSPGAGVGPEQADALHFLGVLAGQTGRLELAIECLSAAVALQPSNSLFLANLGMAYHKHKQPAEAIPCYRQAITLKPDHVEA